MGKTRHTHIWNPYTFKKIHYLLCIISFILKLVIVSAVILAF
jgi:hypothetical protein